MKRKLSPALAILAIVIIVPALIWVVVLADPCQGDPPPEESTNE